MPNEINWGADPSETSYLTTELNSLADGANKMGAAINNSVNLDTHMDVHIALAAPGVARGADAYVAIYVLPSTDGGTTFAYGGDSLDPGREHWVANVSFTADDTARENMAIMLPIPPGYFKILVMNETGQALASTTNTVEYRTYSLEVQ